MKLTASAQFEQHGSGPAAISPTTSTVAPVTASGTRRVPPDKAAGQVRRMGHRVQREGSWRVRPSALRGFNLCMRRRRSLTSLALG
jgi:hypothetical protein